MIIYAHQELTGSLSFAIAVMCNTTGSHISSEKRRDVIVAGRQCYFEKRNVDFDFMTLNTCLKVEFL